MKNLSNSFLLIFLLNNGMILAYHNKNLIIFTNFDAFAFGKSVFRYTAFKLVYNFCCGRQDRNTFSVWFCFGATLFIFMDVIL